jgi:hypothetical protein
MELIKGRLVGCNHETVKTPTGKRTKDEFLVVDDAHGGIKCIVEFKENDDDDVTITVKTLRDDEKGPMSETKQ